MASLWFENVRLVRPGISIAPGCLRVENGSIAEIAPADAPRPVGTNVIDGGGRLLSPGLIDVHTHGIAQYQFEASPDALCKGVQAVTAFGTTTVLPTLVPKAGAHWHETLAQLADTLPTLEGACVPGFHLEGPFMALTGAGCATMPGDVAVLDALFDACRGRLAVMSISPDTPQILPVITRLVERDAVPFITHTCASVAETQAAIEAGARHATHFYDVFPMPAETDPGVRPAGAVEAILADQRATVDFIADGVHVPPIVIHMALASKGWQGVMLITDANIGAGLPAGEYPTPWGYPVRVAPGQGARIAGEHPLAGSLAGSALTMNAGVKNLLQWLPVPPEQVWAMATSNPARLLNLPHKGIIAAGADADLVLWHDDLTPMGTWVAGRQVYAG